MAEPTITELRNARMKVWETLQKEEMKPIRDTLRTLSELFYAAGNSPILNMLSLATFLSDGGSEKIMAISAAVGLVVADLQIKEKEEKLFNNT